MHEPDIHGRDQSGTTTRPRIALALSGGGVIGGMYEVGALTALEERLDGEARGFDVYIGCSAGAVLAALLSAGVRASDLYRILEEDLDDPLNFRRGALFTADSFFRAAGRFGRMVWALGKNVVAGLRESIPDMLTRAERDLPAGFFSLAALERFTREGLASRGYPNSFAASPRKLLIPAVDLDHGARVVFGAGELVNVPISHAVAASAAIPGLFEPYPVGGRDYVDGGVGFTGHADLAADAGAHTVFVVHPLVPGLADSARSVRSRGLYTVLEQASRICAQNLLELGLAVLSASRPATSFFLLEPPRSGTPLFGLAMGFASSRAALHFGYTSTKEWLDSDGAPLLERLTCTTPREPAGTAEVACRLAREQLMAV